MSLCKDRNVSKSGKSVFLIISQYVLGTAEDDMIVGYKKTREEAERFVKSVSGIDDDYHYCIKEVFEIENH